MRGTIVRTAHSAGGEMCGYSVNKRRSGVELVVNCGDCSAEPGLEHPRCFGNVLRAIQQEGVPIAITLRSHVERRYGPTSTATIGLISDIMNRIEILQIQLARDSAKGDACSACLHPLSAKLATVGRGLGTMDLDSAISAARSLDGHMFPGRNSCADCIGITQVQVADISKAARMLEKSVVRGTFNIVEGD